ncbi:MAG: PHP domain-containing protein [Deltaproteobacteria bacterium]|nr:PHP domain-containing protein [Deltaproteobacteria bacterium]
MRLIKADLHLHTCLSPCGELEMSPTAVVERAAELGLALIAITDHNSAENVAAAREAARRLGPAAPHVLAGLEVTTGEEAHMVVLFEDLSAALTFQAMVYDHLQPGENDPDVFGLQVVANADDEVEGFNPRLLIGATDLAVEEVVRRVHSLGGLAVAAHLDRPSYSLVGQLGLLPPDLPLDAVEISARSDPAAADAWLMGRQLTVLTSSDAHQLDMVGRVWSELELAEPCLAELALALAGAQGRGVRGWGRA